MKKKYILIIFTILVILVAAYLLLKNQTNTPNNFPISSPSIPSYITDKQLEIKVDFKQGDFNFPKSLSIYSALAELPFTSDEARKFATQFGFTSDPITATDTLEGTTYIWSTQNNSLTLYSKSRRIEYSVNQQLSTTNKHLSDDDITNIAKKFMVDKGLFLNNDISLSFFVYFIDDPYEDKAVTTTRDKANMFQANFTYNVFSYKLVTLNKDISPIRVTMSLDGTIYNVTAIINKNFQASSKQYPLKDYNQVISDISKGNAKLVTLGSESFSTDPSTFDSIKKVTISQIELGYLADSVLTKVFQPVYILTGMAEINGVTDPVKAVLYLPAVNQ